jgi:hypothetical protein
VSLFLHGLRADLVAAAGRAPAGRSRPARLGRAALALACAALAVTAVIALVPAGGPAARREPAAARWPGGLPGRPLFGGSLEEAVRYRSRVLRPAVSFVATSPRWLAREADDPQWLALEVRSGRRTPAGEAPPVGFVTLFRVRRVYDPARPQGATSGPAPSHLVAWLRRHPDLRAGRPARTVLAGRPAERLDLAVRQPPFRHEGACTARGQPRCVELGPGWEAPAGWRARVYVVATRPGPLVVAVDAPDPRELAAAAREAAPLLAGLRISSP